MDLFEEWHGPALPEPLTKTEIARGWVHQVIVQSYLCTGERFHRQRRFCEGLSLCRNIGSVRIDDVLYRIFCFTDARHARWFREEYKGVSYLPVVRAG